MYAKLIQETEIHCHHSKIITQISKIKKQTFSQIYWTDWKQNRLLYSIAFFQAFKQKPTKLNNNRIKSNTEIILKIKNQHRSLRFPNKNRLKKEKNLTFEVKIGRKMRYYWWGLFKKFVKWKKKWWSEEDYKGCQNFVLNWMNQEYIV